MVWSSKLETCSHASIMPSEKGILSDLSGGKRKESPDENVGFQEKGVHLLGENSADEIRMVGGFEETCRRSGNSGFQELTLSYLCENSKLGFPEKDVSGEKNLNSLEKFSGSCKGKGVRVHENQEEGDSNLWVERDFLKLNENNGKSSIREAENVESEGESREKRPKVKSLDLSLALPDVSQFVTGSNRVQNADFPRATMSVQSVGPSFNNAQTTFSHSYSYSHPVSHNPSCSLTMNSTENYGYSEGSHLRECDHVWNCGEGTNGSVHSRFRPVGDGTVALSNHRGSGFIKDSCNNALYRTLSSENHSFFPSDLPARPRVGGQSGDSRWRASENLSGFEISDVGTARTLSTSERIIREIVSESVPVMAQIIQDLTDETIDSCKEHLKNVISNPGKKAELIYLQKKLERRSDLSRETLSKCQKNQLEILVAIKVEIGGFLNGKTTLPTAELVDIFLLERCRNMNCMRLLPVDDCECKICSTIKGFCSECMCPVCLKFDCANNTCSWVGCDVCSHWCHAACGLERNVIKPGPSLKGISGATEMQFYCLGCGHASEMFGFVKEVFMSCARDWSLETLIKELDCVRKTFRGSEDLKGKKLHFEADEIVLKLESKRIAASDACDLISKFFLSANGLSKISNTQPSFENSAHNPESKTPLYSTNTSNGAPPFHFHQNDMKLPMMMNHNIVEDEWSVKPVKKPGFDHNLESLVRVKESEPRLFQNRADEAQRGFDHNLESLVRVKEAEARMFQNRADEAQRDVESFKRMVRMETEKLEEEYSEKLAKLCVAEAEERRRKKMEELKELENSHHEYYKMKARMQSEISGLLKRMEATKQQIV